MNIQQELEIALKELEAHRTGLKTAGGNDQDRAKKESKLHWLEARVDKLRKKAQS